MEPSYDIKLRPNWTNIENFWNNQTKWHNINTYALNQEIKYIIPELLKWLDSDNKETIDKALTNLSNLYQNGDECNENKDSAILCLKKRARDQEINMSDPGYWLKIRDMRVSTHEIEITDDDITKYNSLPLVKKMFFFKENKHKLSEKSRKILIKKILTDIVNCDEKCLTQRIDGLYPIHLAILLQNDEIIDEILKKNEIKSTIDFGIENQTTIYNTYTPLVLAIKNKNVDAIKKLLNLGADVNKTFDEIDETITPLKYINKYYIIDDPTIKQIIGLLTNRGAKEDTSDGLRQGGSRRKYISKKRISKKRISKKRTIKKQTKKRTMKKSYRKKSKKHRNY